MPRTEFKVTTIIAKILSYPSKNVAVLRIEMYPDDANKYVVRLKTAPKEYKIPFCTESGVVEKFLIALAFITDEQAVIKHDVINNIMTATPI